MRAWDYVVNPATRQTAQWYLNNNVLIGGALVRALSAGWHLVDASDYDGDQRGDFSLLIRALAKGSSAIDCQWRLTKCHDNLRFVREKA